IKIGPRNWEKAPWWGDLQYGRAMHRQLESRGHPCTVQVLEEWDDFEGLEYDVAIHLKGLEPYTTKPAQFNVLWNISHPDLLTSRECDKYDLVFVASERFARELRPGTDTPIVVLEQATDPQFFYPEHDPEHERDMVFVGNSRKVERRILRDLLPTNHDLGVWGGDWEGLIPDRHILGQYLPNDEVRRAYTSASIVLNDHWDDMREHGFVSNRIYDALACGALVISDDLPEIEKSFGDAVITYSTPEELNELVGHYMNSPQERADKGEKGRELVLRRHTFEHRMSEFLEHLDRRRREVDASGKERAIGKGRA
ncbi:MAG: glycosyltransferase, partial [Rubrobacter sp.]|nr:glycosyltransferase [Rubrobacter sp.]